MATGVTAVVDLKDYTCAICQDIFQHPLLLKCKHSYCEECVKGLTTAQRTHTCPICQDVSYPHEIRADENLRQQLITKRGLCDGCKRNFFLNEFRRHKAVCDKLNPPPKLTFTPVAPTSQVFPINQPNRQTFACPYCDKKNLDCTGLVAHVKQAHAMDHNHKRVCPICAAMPWGDPNLVSQNLHQHMNIRHKFEYDRYVDFNEEEDKIFQDVLQRSLVDK